MAPAISTRGAIRINLGSVVFWPALFVVALAAAIGGAAYTVWASVERVDGGGLGVVGILVGGAVALGAWKLWRAGTPHLLVDVPAGMIHFRGYKAGSCRLADLEPQIESYKDVARVTSTMYRVIARGLDNARLYRTPYEAEAQRFVARLRDYADDAAIRGILATSPAGDGAFRDTDAPRRIRESVPDDARRAQALGRLAQDRDAEIAARARTVAA